MAKDFKLRQRGGRFNQGNVGDSTGPIRRQSEAITTALKENALRHDQYGRDYIEGLVRQGNAESDNRRILQQLETKKWNTQLDAIQVRKSTEVEHLESLAKEYGKKAEYYREVSPTAHANYWNLFEFAYSEWRKKVAQKKADEYDDNEIDILPPDAPDDYKPGEATPGVNPYKEPTAEISFASKGLDKNNVTDSSYPKLRSNIYNEALVANTKVGWEVVAAGVELSSSTNPNAHKAVEATNLTKLDFWGRQALTNKIINDSSLLNKIETFLSDSVHNDPKFRYNSNTVVGIYKDFGSRIAQSHGIDPNTDEGRQVVNHFRSKGIIQKNKLYGQEQVLSSSTELLKSYAVFKNSLEGSFVREMALENLFTSKQNTWENGKNGTFIKPLHKTNRVLDGIIPTFKFLIDQGYYDGPDGKDKLTSDWSEHKTWDKNGQTNITLGKRYEKQPYFTDLLKHWNTRNDDRTEARETEDEADVNQRILEMDEYVTKQADGLNTHSKQETFINNYIIGAHPDVAEHGRKLISAATGIMHTKDAFKHAKLYKAFSEGDLNEFYLTYAVLPEAERVKYSPMFKSLKTLENGVLSFSSTDPIKHINKKIDEALKTVWGDQQFSGTHKGVMDSSWSEAKPVILGVFISELGNLEDNTTMSDRQKVRTALGIALKPYQDRTGIGTIIPNGAEIPGTEDKNTSGAPIPGTVKQNKRGAILAAFSTTIPGRKYTEDDVISKILGPNGYELKEWNTDQDAGADATLVESGSYMDKIAVDALDLKTDSPKIKSLLNDVNFITNTELGNIFEFAVTGENKIQLPKNLQLLNAVTDIPKKDLLNYLFQSRGFTTKQVTLPSDEESIIQGEVKTRRFLNGTSTRHYKNLNPILY